MFSSLFFSSDCPYFFAVCHPPVSLLFVRPLPACRGFYQSKPTRCSSAFCLRRQDSLSASPFSVEFHPLAAWIDGRSCLLQFFGFRRSSSQCTTELRKSSSWVVRSFPYSLSFWWFLCVRRCQQFKSLLQSDPFTPSAGRVHRITGPWPSASPQLQLFPIGCCWLQLVNL